MAIRVAHGRKSGQFLETLRSKVVIDGAALPPREFPDQELCPAHDDRNSKPEIILLVCRLRWFRTLVRGLVKTANVGDGVRDDEPGTPRGLINARTSPSQLIAVPTPSMTSRV